MTRLGLTGSAIVAARAERRARSGYRAGSGHTRSLKLRSGTGLLALLVVAGIVVPLLHSGYNSESLLTRLLPPSGAHPFGTDELGRDVFTRCLAAVRIDLPLGIVGALLPSILGTALGLVSGYAGKWADQLIMRTGDMIQAFPSYILLVILAFIVGPGIESFLISLAILSWVAYARLVRAQVLLLREQDFIHAARLGGIGQARVLVRHLLPNVLPQVIVYLAADATFALITLSGLSFLGLGIENPTPEWGLMLSDGRLFINSAWWLTTFPGLMIVLAAGAFALISDALDDRSRI